MVPTFSAGNDGNKQHIDRPACLKYAIGVGGSYNNRPEYLASATLVDKVAKGSDSGPEPELFAPSYSLNLPSSNVNGLPGTSFSAPQVAAAATLLRASSRFATDSASCIVKRLQSTAQPIQQLNCRGFQFFPGCDSAADCVPGEACLAAQTGTCVGGPFNGEPCGQASDCQGGSCPLHTVTFPRLNIGAAAATAPTLAADCDHNNVVFVNDVAKIVAILLGNQLLLTCPTADLNGNLNIEINEIVSAANAANTGCPLGATEFTGVY